MVKKAIVALACVLIASPAFAQTTTNRTRHYRTTTVVTREGALPVTSLLGLWSFAPTVRIRSGLIYQVPGLSMTSLGDR